MLKSADNIAYKLVEYTPNAETLTIKVRLNTGRSINDVFVSDGRPTLNLTIMNIPDKAVRQEETLIVDASGQITLALVPVDGNPIEVDSVTQDHISGQFVDCANNTEGETVVVKYYHTIAGEDWFNKAAAFVKEDHPECLRMNDYEYNKYRVYAILTAMGLIAGEVI